MIGMNGYLWLKALHVISIIAWMAAILYLPRLFVYHCAAPAGSSEAETFKVMERRLLRAIMTPAMVVAWLSGLSLAYWGSYLPAGWLHLKLTFVLILSGLHGYLSACVRRFAQDQNRRSARFYRFINEVPTLCMIVIVVAVIVKPF